MILYAFSIILALTNRWQLSTGSAISQNNLCKGDAVASIARVSKTVLFDTLPSPLLNHRISE
jgi:hypothetical protein